MGKPINIIFDGPPGPESGRFIEVETDDGKSINIGEWSEICRSGIWALRITELPEGSMDKSVEAKYIASVMVMGTESLSPNIYTELENALRDICEARSIPNEFLADIYKRVSGKKNHASDCATSEAPAHMPGSCDCDVKMGCPVCGSPIVDGKCSDVGGKNCGYTTE